MFSCDDILHHAKPNGVSRVVLVQMSYYGYDNSYMLEAVRRRPEFSGALPWLTGIAAARKRRC